MILVKWVRAFAMFWYDFIVGDDWLLAVGAIVALGVTALLAHVAKVPSWWLIVVVVVGVIVISTLRAGRTMVRPAAPAQDAVQVVEAADPTGPTAPPTVQAGTMPEHPCVPD